MITREDVSRVVGRPVYDVRGRKIGPAKHMYLDDSTGEPVWVTVGTGLFGGRETFVPTGAARVVEGHLEVPFAKAEVRGAPSVALDTDGHLSAEQESRLYGYYGAEPPVAPPAGPAGTDGPTAMSGSEAGVGSAQPEARPQAQPEAQPQPPSSQPLPEKEPAQGDWSGTCSVGDRPRSRRGQPWPEEEMGPGTGRRRDEPER
jgi:hypothetical protein